MRFGCVPRPGPAETPPMPNRKLGALAAFIAVSFLAAGLGSSARLELCFEGLDAAGIAELRRVAEQRGARFLGAQPAQSNLVELYRRASAARTS